MYEAYFGIFGLPFQLSPDQRFYFESRAHREALDVLRRELSEPGGFVVLSGPAGVGKTMLMGRLTQGVEATRHHVGQIMYSQLNADELLCAVLVAFGAPVDGDTPEAWRKAIDDFLDAEAGKGRHMALVIDEAQNLEADALKRLAELERERSSSPLPLKVFLVGQPELRTLVESEDMRALRDRVVAFCGLDPLGDEDTAAYVRHRLDRVGWKGRPSFTADAFAEIHRWTGGVPRRINMLCNRLLLGCFLAMSTEIDAAMVESTARALRAETGDTWPAPPDSRKPQAKDAAPGTTAPAPAASPTPRPAPTPAPTPAEAPVPGTPATVDLELDVDLSEDADASHPAVPPLRGGEDSRPLLLVLGGQGDHVKAAALLHAFARRPDLPVALLVRCYANSAFERHRDMFEGLDVAGRLVSLGIAIGTYAGRAAELMKRFEFIVDQCQPAAVMVFDGSDAALSCGLVASRKSIPVLHVGAGLRSGTNGDAADITRRLVDQLSDVLYTTEARANQQLAQEGVAAERIRFVGNTVADAVQIALRSAMATPTARERLGLPPNLLNDRNGYGVVVLDGASNVGDRDVLAELISILRAVAHDVPLVWPMHTRTRELLAKFRLDAVVASERIAVLPSQSYPSLVQLMSNATCVLTDSWIVQEETTILAVPCLTIGVGHERAITTEVGSNIMIGRNKAVATRVMWDCIFNGGKRGRTPELWDGRASERIAGHAAAFLASRRTARSGLTA
jgi:UDP-N-acetylglucosamine 2-epimerase